MPHIDITAPVLAAADVPLQDAYKAGQEYVQNTPITSYNDNGVSNVAIEYSNMQLAASAQSNAVKYQTAYDLALNAFKAGNTVSTTEGGIILKAIHDAAAAFGTTPQASAPQSGRPTPTIEGTTYPTTGLAQSTPPTASATAAGTNPTPIQTPEAIGIISSVAAGGSTGPSGKMLQFFVQNPTAAPQAIDLLNKLAEMQVQVVPVGNVIQEKASLIISDTNTLLPLPIGLPYGYGTPTGTQRRDTFDADETTTISASPTQAQVQAVNDRLLLTRQILATLIADLQRVNIAPTRTA